MTEHIKHNEGSSSNVVQQDDKLSSFDVVQQYYEASSSDSVEQYVNRRNILPKYLPQLNFPFYVIEFANYLSTSTMPRRLRKINMKVKCNQVRN